LNEQLFMIVKMNKLKQPKLDNLTQDQSHEEN
jgi:hypothetical protein